MRLFLLYCLLFSLSSAIVTQLDKQKDLPVCIIGAGMAGLSAAFELEKAGMKYILIEGATRVGGRVYPVEYEDGFLQYGATYINGDKNPIFEIAQDNGLVDMNTTDAADDYVPIYTEEEVIEGCDVREFTAFTESCIEKYKEYARHGRAMETFIHEFDRDYQAFLKHKNRESRRSHFDHLARMYVTDMETEWAALMNKYALSNYEHDQYDDMTEFTLNKEGFHKILDVIKNRVPTDKINFQQEVKNIDYSNKESVTLTTTKEKFDCSSAIITVSLGYLKKHSPTLFTPKLPEMKANVIRELGFGNMQKLFLIYDKPWLEKSAYHTMGPAASPVFGRGLTFDVTPWPFNSGFLVVELIGQMSDEKLIEEITTHLRKTLKNATVPTAKSVVRHMWYQDPLVLGSYSYLTPGAVALKDPNQKLAEPILGSNGKPLVQFAGEATHSTIYQTTIGAFLSGQREARRLTPPEMSNVKPRTKSGHMSYIDVV